MTREEAIIAIRGFMGQLTEGCQEALISAIPELAESEDERIRMALIEGVSQIRCKGDVTREQMIAYLEKVREKSLIPDALVEGYKKCVLSELVEGAKIVNAINGCQNKESITDSAMFEEGFKTGLEVRLRDQKEQKVTEFTHHEINESLKDAVTHQMEDDGDVDDFVRRGIDDIVLKYAELGAKW